MNIVMTFTGLELAAMVKLGLAMARVDGRVDDNENAAIAFELVGFGVSEDKIESILVAAEAMSATDAIVALSSMSSIKQKYATGYFAVIMAADGQIEDEELKLWKLICTLANFPGMTVSEALEFWKTH